MDGRIDMSDLRLQSTGARLGRGHDVSVLKFLNYLLDLPSFRSKMILPERQRSARGLIVSNGHSQETCRTVAVAMIIV